MIRRAHPEGGGDPRLPGAVRLARDAAALWLGHRRHPGHRRDHRPRRRAEGDRPGRRRHHQRRLDPPLLRQRRRRRARPTRTAEATIIQTRHRIPETAAAARARSWSSRCRSPSRCASSSRARPRRARMHALAEYGLMHVKLYEDIARHGQIATTYDYPVMVNGRYLMDPSPIPEFDNPKMHRIAGAAAVRRRPREAHLRRAALHRGASASTSRTIRSRCRRFDQPCALCGADDVYLDEVVTRRPRRPDVRLLRHRPLRDAAADGHRGDSTASREAAE